jgi:hypothetical protein
MIGLSSQPRLGAGGARATTARHLDGLAKEAHKRFEAVWRENAFEPLAHSDSEDVWAIQTNLIEEANLKEEDVVVGVRARAARVGEQPSALAKCPP